VSRPSSPPDLADAGAEIPAEASIEVEDLASGTAVVVLRGEHDLNGKTRLAEVLAHALRRGNVVVDLEPCTFLDSMVIATLLSATRRAEAVGVLGLVVPPEAEIVARIASLMRISSFVPIHPSRALAIASIQDEE
jgi:anti-anti-sigma factor